MDNEYDIIVIGLGIFGLSACYEIYLNHSHKYKKILALDASEVIPSTFSAANDLNKIFRAEYSDEMYTRLSIEAYEEWLNNADFCNEFSQCGRILLTPQLAENSDRKKFELQGYENMEKLGYLHPSDIKFLRSKEEISNYFYKWFSDNSLPNDSTATFNSKSGVIYTARSMKRIYEILKLNKNIEFKLGLSGTVNKIDDCKVTAGTSTYRSKGKILVCCGSFTANIIDCKGQVDSLGLLTTHIQLTKKEYEKYASMPIFFSSEKGYFFPPEKESRKIKIALTHIDFSNTVSNPLNESEKVSIAKYVDLKILPFDAEKQAYKLLKEMIPELGYHKLEDHHLCWISDSSDLNFLIDRVPNSSGNLYVATGDSGHAAKFFPNIGKYIIKRLEGNLSSDWSAKWAWKDYPEKPKNYITRAKRIHMELQKCSTKL